MGNQERFYRAGEEIEYLATENLDGGRRWLSTIWNGQLLLWRVRHPDNAIRDVPEIQVWCTDNSLRLVRFERGEIMVGNALRLDTEFKHMTVDHRDERQDGEFWFRDHQNRAFRTGMEKIFPPFDRAIGIYVAYH